MHRNSPNQIGEGCFRLLEDQLKKMLKAINTMEGVNFNTFIGRLRIAEAQAIMNEAPSTSFAELAAMVGFSEQSNFSRQFKAITGFTPSEYRRNLTSSN